jgi:hypothetical protein
MPGSSFGGPARQYRGSGVNYAYFELPGDITEDSWRGAISTTFTGPYLYVRGSW